MFLQKTSEIGFSASKRTFYWSCILLSNRGPVAHPGWYPRDHQPGQYPKTEKERRAAAMKYGLRPEDYKPLPFEDKYHAGDYPDLGHLPFGDRDPWQNYVGFEIQNRNWGEPMPRDIITHTRDRRAETSLEEAEKTFWPVLKILSKGWLILIVLGGIFYYQGDYMGFHLRMMAMPKQYPYDLKRAFPGDSPLQYPVVNYTFEPETELKDQH